MRSSLFGFLVVLLGCSAATVSQAQVTHVRIEASGGENTPHAWIGAAPAQSRLVVGSDGRTYIGIWLDAPQNQQTTQRAPLDLALVVDVSGSMSGPKIVNARMAATSMLESLSDGDIVSVYAFSNDVMEIAAPTVVSSQTRGDLIQRVSMLQPMGGTNMYDGLRIGETRASEAPASHPVRRVVLISDGMANIGPSSAEELGNLAAQGTESGAQVSAIGVGLDYDEATLGALAMRSSGRMYHLEDPSQMAAILREELQRLSNTVATDAYIEVTPSAGVQIDGAEAVPVENVGGATRIRLGAVTGGQHREFLLRAHVDTNAVGDHPLASARLVFHEPAGSHAAREQNVRLAYDVTSDASVAQRSANARVSTMLASNHAAQAQIHAGQLMNRGDVSGATRELAAATAALTTVAAAAPADERVRVEHQAAAMRRNLESATRAPAASAGAGGAGRAGALQMSADSYSAMGL